MFTQPKILPVGLCEKEDLIDDIPELETYRTPFLPISREPDGYEGIAAYWDVLDADEKPVAIVYCRDVALAMVRLLNRHDELSADPGPIVVSFVNAPDRR